MLPDLYGDFQDIKTAPETAMATTVIGQLDQQKHFSRAQVDRLVRDIDQIFEIRANSELESPKQEAVQRVFITHGRSNDWRAVQTFIEKDIRLSTIELGQEANMGRTIIEKLIDNAERCNCAVIVMTGDDVINEDEARVRENVMHEIGFFQGRYGRNLWFYCTKMGLIFQRTLLALRTSLFPKATLRLAFTCYNGS
jgi:predicted nucleotide-binding protein